ncbi:hypothetical protein B0A49_00271 [Cryomyces minteri]|uniref:Sec20 C-terminal domain-containing protein n=1 Tax=Cryomyces minteri TaxID=331657 RepID=A0A4U0XUG5_9PEZI|nr:hypothetical protein B0A49_00271 [Cryomyces minteri]
MTTQSLTARLTALSGANKASFHLIHRLSKLTFHPGSIPLDGDEGDVRTELSSEIHDSLKQQEEDFELLRQEVEDLIGGSSVGSRRRNSEKDRETARLSAQVARLTEDLRQARIQFRRAQLSAKRAAEAAKAKERQLLFASLQDGSSGTSTPTNRHRAGHDKLSQDEVLVGASSDVTAALRRTHQLMQSELSRSRFAQETLEQSTAALADLSEQYGSLDSLLSSSRSLLSTLLRSQKSDTWYLETAFYILLTTIFWLFFRRLLYGPLWWFLWLPLKLTYRLVFSLLAAIGLTGSAARSNTTALSASTATTTTTTRPPLIVKPSASNGPPPRRPNMSGQAPYVPAGGGGAGAKVQPGSNSPSNVHHSLSEQVARMAEASSKPAPKPPHRAPAQQQQAQRSGGDDQGERRGDGQLLQESDRPRNPKKRMWQEPEEAATFAAQQQQQQQQ